ncbi:MAG: hypothetical protein NTV86_09970 [Planctomycetota bacterium]|nr:hypothetical protein [Planctomycetota bacterium]
MNDSEPERLPVVRKAKIRSIAAKDTPAKGLMRRVLAYEPVPVDPPKVDADFPEMPLVPRTLESLRYMACLLEYKIGPNGWFRAWALLWVRLSVLLLAPTLALIVIVQFMIPLFAGLAEVAGHAHRAMRSGFFALLWLVLSALLIATVVAVVWAFLRSKLHK